VRADRTLLPQLVQIVERFAWTRGYVTAAAWLGWLDALPLEQRLVLPDGTRLLGVHASPGHDDNPGIHPGTSDDELRALLAGCAADLVCVGHTHWPLDRRVDGVRVVNLGSVSNPTGRDLRASYALLDTRAEGYEVRQRRVEYDHEAVIEAVRRSRHPSTEYIIASSAANTGPRGREAELAAPCGSSTEGVKR